MGDRGAAAYISHNEKQKAYKVHSRDELQPYSKFPHIYGELKYQRMVTKPQTLSFLQLPAEIRLQIYELIFLLHEPVELWAETGNQYKDPVIRRNNGQAYRKMFKQAHNLRFLRSCKQVNVEAAAIFYGKNEFRFSGINGHMVAHAFLVKIGPCNWTHIKTMTIALPFRSHITNMFLRNWHATAPISAKQIDNIYNAMPFSFPQGLGRYGKYASLQFDSTWTSLAEILSTQLRLQSISFVLPEDRIYTSDWRRGRGTFDTKGLQELKDVASAAPFLEINIVRMCHASDPVTVVLSSDHAFLIKTLKSIATCRIQFATFHKKGKWFLADPQPYVDGRGGFVSDKLMDASDVSTDILPDIRRMFEGMWAEGN